MRYNGPLPSPWKRPLSWRRTCCCTNSLWLLFSSSPSSSMAGGPISYAACPSRPSHPPSPDANAPKTPSLFPGSSPNRSARPVSRGPRPVSQRPAHPLRSSLAPEGAGAPSTPTRLSVRLPIAPLMAGAVGAPFAPMALPAASPGASSSASPATETWMRRTARCCRASAPRQSASGVSWHSWPKAGAAGARPGASRSIRTPSASGW